MFGSILRAWRWASWPSLVILGFILTTGTARAQYRSDVSPIPQQSATGSRNPVLALKVTPLRALPKQLLVFEVTEKGFDEHGWGKVTLSITGITANGSFSTALALDGHGKASRALPIGQYRATASIKPSTIGSPTKVAAPLHSNTVVIVVAPEVRQKVEPDLDLVVHQLAPGRTQFVARLRGSGVDGTNQPVSFAVTRDSQPLSPLSGTLGRPLAGDFTQPGRYEVTASMQHHGWELTSDVKSFVVLEPPPPARLQLSVTELASGGQFQFLATVDGAHWAGGAPVHFLLTRDAVTSAETGFLGKPFLRDLPPGSYTVVAVTNGGERELRSASHAFSIPLPRVDTDPPWGLLVLGAALALTVVAGGYALVRRSPNVPMAAAVRAVQFVPSCPQVAWRVVSSSSTVHASPIAAPRVILRVHIEPPRYDVRFESTIGGQ